MGEGDGFDADFEVSGFLKPDYMFSQTECIQNGSNHFYVNIFLRNKKSYCLVSVFFKILFYYTAIYISPYGFTYRCKIFFSIRGVVLVRKIVKT